MNKYAKLTKEDQEKHLDQFLVDRLSHSALSTFVRNEKAFEMNYVFKCRNNAGGISMHVGRIYHDVLMVFFNRLRYSGDQISIDQLMEYAHEFIEEIPPTQFKPQVKTPTVESAKLEILKKVNFALISFVSEIETYTSIIQEIVFIEETFDHFITLNGVDIPLPFKGIIDLVFIDKDGNLAILDHKTTSTYTAPEAIDLKYSSQTLIYVLFLEEEIKSGRMDPWIEKYPKVKDGVQKFYFYENKISKNSNGENQIKPIGINTIEARQFYEAMLFEVATRVCRAVNDPNYIYLMNPNDYFTNPSEIIDFYIRSTINDEIDGFENLTEAEKTKLKKRRSQIMGAKLEKIPKHILENFKTNITKFTTFSTKEMETMNPSEKIEHRLRCLNTPVKVEHVIEGYSNDLYLLNVAAGLKISSVFKHKLDIANVLNVEKVRFNKNLVKYDGQSFIGVETGKKPSGEMLYIDNFMKDWKIPIGKDNFKNTHYWDVQDPSTPHVMVSGSSGSGKSVCLEVMIDSILKNDPEKIVILDPKYEFTNYKNDKIQVIQDQQDIEDFMEYTVLEVDEIFKKYGARGNEAKQKFIIFDEAADCLEKQTKKRFTVNHDTGKRSQDYDFKTLEQNTLILAQKARSAGYHMILSAQRFSTKVLTGDAKANFAVKIGFYMSKKADSMVLFDETGCQDLVGKGDCLFSLPSYSEPVRLQGFMSKDR